MDLKFDVWHPDVESKHLSPIILLHSMMETRKTWKNIAPDLSRKTNRTVYAIDDRNHGESPWSEMYSFDTMVKDLELFLHKHHLHKVILVGHSMGGKTAINFTLRWPDKVEKLIVEDSTPRDFKNQGGNFVTGVVSILKSSNQLISETDGAEECQKLVTKIMLQFQKILKVPREKIENYDFSLLPFRWRENAYVFDLDIDAIGDFFRFGQLEQKLTGKYEGNTLFLLGQKSQFRIHEDPTLEEFFPNMKKEVIENFGHFIHQAYPKFVDIVADFINDSTFIGSKY